MGMRFRQRLRLQCRVSLQPRGSVRTISDFCKRTGQTTGLRALGFYIPSDTAPWALPGHFPWGQQMCLQTHIYAFNGYIP
jgi:hypothetical protein